MSSLRTPAVVVCVAAMALYGDATAALSPDSRLYNPSAMATAKIEGDQHYEELRKAGVLRLRRDVIVRARARRAAAEEGGEDGPPHPPRPGLPQPPRRRLPGLRAIRRLHRRRRRTTYVRPEIEDAPLTALGRTQAKGLRVATKILSGIELVVVSPLRRAETAALSMPHLRTVVPWVGHPAVQETSGKHTCDRRRDRSEIKDDFPWVDWGLVKPERDGVWTADREQPKAVSDRAYAFLLWLRERPEREVAVATHSAWLFTLLNSCVDCADPQLAAWFLTGELRSVVLSYEDDILSDVDQQVKDAFGYTYPIPPKDDDGNVVDWAAKGDL
ncbi:isomerase [Aureococcus anophagefferens]|nr:isomerase [Aureococcus anophagefferens]